MKVAIRQIDVALSSFLSPQGIENLSCALRSVIVPPEAGGLDSVTIRLHAYYLLPHSDEDDSDPRRLLMLFQGSTTRYAKSMIVQLIHSLRTVGFAVKDSNMKSPPLFRSCATTHKTAELDILLVRKVSQPLPGPEFDDPKVVWDVDCLPVINAKSLFTNVPGKHATRQWTYDHQTRRAWKLLRQHVRMRTILFYWYELAGRRSCDADGRQRAADRAAFEKDM